MPQPMDRPRTLLGVWAHPDDEAYLSAGLILEHTRRGDRVVIVTATLGEHGTKDARRYPTAVPRGAATSRAARLCGDAWCARVARARFRGRHLRSPRRHRPHRAAHRSNSARSHRDVRARRSDRPQRPPGRVALDHRRVDRHRRQRRTFRAASMDEAWRSAQRLVAS
jgi:hypothetical protein